MADEHTFLEQMRPHQRIVLRLVGLYANNAEERKEFTAGSVPGA